MSDEWSEGTAVISSSFRIVSLALVEDTDTIGPRFLKVDSVDGTNVTVKVNVSRASATSGAPQG